MQDILYTESLPDTIFTFPSTLVRPGSPSWIGIAIFPEEYRWKYKVRMTYRIATKDDWLHIECPFGVDKLPLRYFFCPYYEEQKIFIESISREDN